MSKRAMYAVLAWVAATATAMAVVWAGLDSVLPTAAAGPRVATIAAWPVQDADSADSESSSAGTPSPSASASSSLGTALTTAGRGASTAAASAAAPSTTAAAPSAPASAGSGVSASSGTSGGTESRYTTAGGTAVLTLGSKSATLDAAIPATGFSARSWTGSDFLEVEFSPSDAGTVYEVIATWNGTSPQVNTYAVGG